MSRNVVMTLDTREVQRNLDRLNHVVMPAKIRKGLMAAGNRLMIDSVIGLPTMPIKRPGYPPLTQRQAGELRASGAVFMDGTKVGSSAQYGEMATGKYQPDSYGGTPIPPMSHEACVVFNAPYAAKQHEKFPEKTQQGAGMHYMSEKLYGNAPEYIAIIAEAIRL